jgi:prolyl 4-hydroxylase
VRAVARATVVAAARVERIVAEESTSRLALVYISPRRFRLRNELARKHLDTTTAGTARAAQHDAVGRHDEAINELARATQAGDIEAMTELGKRLIVGDRAPLLPADGTRFLADAMQAGSSEAALRLAAMAALGAHTEQSWSRALGLLVRAAEQGSESARNQLCVLASCPPADASRAGDWRGVAARVDLRSWLAPLPGVTLHAQPLVRSFARFIPERACDSLIARARGRLRRALIYDPARGGDVSDQMRTNSVAGFDLMDADVVQIAIQHRIAAVVGVPVHNLEGPTVLHYEVGQEITNHFDFVNPEMPSYDDEISRRGERIVTFLIYLNDDYAGGETDFPELGVRHKGRRREGLFFVNALPNGKPDTRMVHAGRAPTRGEKWVFSQFIRNRAALNARAERVG